MMVGVLGCGTMGSQIAALFAWYGHSIRVRDLNDALRIEQRIQKQVKLSARLMGKDHADVTGAMARVLVTSDIAELQECSLIVEAVSETMDAKRIALNSLHGLLDGGAIVVTNTSSLSVTELSSVMEDPSRFLGLHFFNPVVKLRFAEVVKHDRVDNTVLEEVYRILQDLDCHGITSPDIPGFLVNRVLFAMIGESLRLIETTGVTAEALDLAVKSAALHPSGPLGLVKWLGRDLCRDVLKNLHERTGEEVFRLPEAWSEED